jgi:hypothetical protein
MRPAVWISGKPSGAACGVRSLHRGEIDPGRSTVFVRNPDYWGNDLPLNRGRHNFESIRVEYYADAIAAFEGFTAGNYLFRQENSSQNWANNYDFPRLNDGTVIREEIPQGTDRERASPSCSTCGARSSRIPRVREAIALMFNFEWTNQTLFYGFYSPIDSFWENTHLEAEGLAPPEELAVLEPFRDRLPEEVFTEVPFATPTSNPDRTFDRSQARRATALLEEAGWTPGDDGMLRNEAGETLEVEFLNAGPLFDRIINPYVENLRAIGIDARLNRVDGAQMSQRQRDADFDIITDHFPMGYEPGTEPAPVFRHDGGRRVAVQRRGFGRPGDRRAAGDGDPRRDARRDGDCDACARPGAARLSHPGAAMVQRQLLGRLLQPLPLSGGASALWHRLPRFLVGRPGGRAGACAIRACCNPMGAYILRRLLLMIPTLFGIMVVNFALTQFVPGGPVEQVLAQLEGEGDVLRRHLRRRQRGDAARPRSRTGYQGARGLPPQFLDELRVQFNFARIVCEEGFTKGEPDLDAEACVARGHPGIERFG